MQWSSQRGVRTIWFRTPLLFLFSSLLLIQVGSGASAAQDDATALILELLGDKDKDVRALALEQVRTEAKGEAATRKFAEHLPKLAPEAQVGLLGALAARGDRSAAPAVRELLAKSTQEPVQVAAIETLGTLGSGEDASRLLELLASENKAQAAAARASLTRLPGDAALEAITSALKSAQTDQKIALIDILRTRRAGVPALLEAAQDSDAKVRTAAMNVLGELAGPEQIPGLIQGVLKAKPGAERSAAERAVALVCRRIPEVDHQAQPLLAAIDDLSPRYRLALLPMAGRVGGSAVRSRAEEALRADDTEQRDAGLAILCNWPDGTVASRLLELARTDASSEYRRAARFALLRIAPLPDNRTDQRRLDLLQTVFVMAENDRERNAVIDRAKAIRSMESLRFVVPFLDQPTFAQQACETIVELAHHRNLREPNKAVFDPLLDRVTELSRDETVRDRAQRYKKGQTWVRPKSGDSP